MTIQWSLFGLGVLLLLFPADRLLSSVVELRSFDSFQSLENSPRYRPWWWVPALWLDPLRGFFGTLVLKQSLALTSVSWALTPTAAYVSALGILVLGGTGQTLTRRGGHGTLLAPMGYVAGVVAALTPWPVALIAIVSAALCLFAFRQFHAFFAFGSIAVALVGFALGAEVVWIAPAVGAFALPFFAGVVTGNSLELPTRNALGPARSRRSST